MVGYSVGQLGSGRMGRVVEGVARGEEKDSKCNDTGWRATAGLKGPPGNTGSRLPAGIARPLCEFDFIVEALSGPTVLPSPRAVSLSLDALWLKATWEGGDLSSSDSASARRSTRYSDHCTEPAPFNRMRASRAGMLV